MFDEAKPLELLNNYYAEIREYPHDAQWSLRPEELVAGRALLGVDDKTRIALIYVALN
jgi:hypothetical protein